MDEQRYDKIMHKARKIFQDRWNEYNDPYAFHKAFEYASNEINKQYNYDELAEKYADKANLDDKTYKGDVVTAFVCGMMRARK